MDLISKLIEAAPKELREQAGKRAIILCTTRDYLNIRYRSEIRGVKINREVQKRDYTVWVEGCLIVKMDGWEDFDRICFSVPGNFNGSFYDNDYTVGSTIIYD